jgi:probable phosphoglycerate mutase
MILVRHGEVDANITFRFLGRGDDPLNETGARQAEQLAALFREIPVTLVFTSPLARTRTTAESIADAAGARLLSDDRLVELDFGEWEGLTRAQIADRSQEDRKLLERWAADPLCPAPGGESLAAVRDRIVDFADRLCAEHPGATVAVVSHMGPIKALICAALQLPLTGAGRLFLDPATLSVVDWSVTPVVRLVNDHAHLGWSHARWLSTPPAGR